MIKKLWDEYDCSDEQQSSKRERISRECARLHADIHGEGCQCGWLWLGHARWRPDARDADSPDSPQDLE